MIGTALFPFLVSQVCFVVFVYYDHPQKPNSLGFVHDVTLARFLVDPPETWISSCYKLCSRDSVLSFSRLAISLRAYLVGRNKNEWKVIKVYSHVWLALEKEMIIQNGITFPLNR